MTSVANSGTGSVIVHCPAAHPFLLGGGAFVGANDSLAVSEPAFTGEEAAGVGLWLAEDTQGGLVTGYALCAK